MTNSKRLNVIYINYKLIKFKTLSKKCGEHLIAYKELYASN